MPIFLFSGVVCVAPHADSQFVSGKQSLWIDQRWRPSDASDKDSNRSEAKLLSNHHLMTGEMTEATDYAEVDPQSLTTFYNTTNKAGMMQMHPQFLHQYQMQQQQQDLTPYATTTLIQQRRPNYVRSGSFLTYTFIISFIYFTHICFQDNCGKVLLNIHMQCTE